ncbi:MAG: YigZ family protein [Bacillota bacterium]
MHIVQKSRFLGVCVRVEDEAQAAEVIEAQRKKYHDARHHCYAFVTGQTRRSSDDGEPSGTAGMPILEVLLKNGVNNALIVVTRYFGGVLLGTGGLVRAYSAAAAQALEDARPVTMHEAVFYRIELDYARYSRLQGFVKSVDAQVLHEDFGADVNIELAVRASEEAVFCMRFKEFTEGKGSILETGRGYHAWPEEE